MPAVPEDLRRIVADVVHEEGCSLYHLEYMQGKLEIYIEKEGGATLGDCERITKKLGLNLREIGDEKRNLVLEVSTPGIERYLYEPDHYRKAVGERLHIKLASEFLEGRLMKVEEWGVELDIAGLSRRLTYNEILSARVVRTTEELFKRR